MSKYVFGNIKDYKIGHKDHAIDIKYLINHKNRAMNYEN